MKDIYISNLSEYTTKRMIFDHFRKYGEIIELKMTCLPNGKSKGYAKMTVLNEEVAGIILSSDHTIDNRDIKVEPFIKREDDILKSDIEVARRRVCVVGIPKSLNDAQFFEYFEKEIGGVENAYIRINKSKVVNYGFVTFNSEKMAIKAKRRKIMMIYDPEMKKEVKLNIKNFESRKEKAITNENEDKNIFKIRTNTDAVVYLNIFGEFKVDKLHRLLRFDFIPKERILDYVKNIMKSNNLLKITECDITAIEPFYFNNMTREMNKNRRGAIYYKGILLSTRKINCNHNKHNIVFRYRRKNPEQKFIAKIPFWTQKYKRKRKKPQAQQLIDLFNAIILRSASNFQGDIMNGEYY